jgi:hypothetical protein
MHGLYRYIIDGMQRSGGLYKPTPGYPFARYLQDLQESVIYLRGVFRANRVVVNYSSPEMQAAYLIAYYPQYAEMTLNILNSLSPELTFEQELKACFFARSCPSR